MIAIIVGNNGQSVMREEKQLQWLPRDESSPRRSGKAGLIICDQIGAIIRRTLRVWKIKVSPV